MSAILLDPFLPEVLRDPYPFYRELRRSAPVVRFDRQRMWGVVRYRDAVAVLQQPGAFSSSPMAVFDPLLLGADPPDHGRFRRFVSGFWSDQVAALEQRIAEIADRLLAPIRDRGSFDLIDDVASPLTLTVMAETLGVPHALWRDLKRWSSAVIARATGSLTADETRRIDIELAELHSFLQDHVAQCERDTGGSLLSRLLRADDHAFTRHEAISFARLLMIAGNETTTNLIGNAMLALLEDPAQMEAEPWSRPRVEALVEEALRYDAPVQHVVRQTTRDVEIEGVRVSAGSRVAVFLGSANRDPDEFADPDTFSIARKAPQHLAFGFGAHYCLGSQLARLEARIALEQLLRGPWTLRPAAPLADVERIDSTQMRGLKRLPLRLEERAPRPQERRV